MPAELEPGLAMAGPQPLVSGLPRQVTEAGCPSGGSAAPRCPPAGTGRPICWGSRNYAEDN